ncbi:MAG TPA: GNAT family N-acetyltransferase [Rhizomicrobium sp.]|nr:GNAT family N-acetyltransferase [Rhizomicrobium sp.]
MERGVTIRLARPDDAASVARVYIDSWQDTYPGILSTQLLCAMSRRGLASSWQAVIAARGRESVLVAEMGRHGVIGMTSFGPSRDASLGFDGEVYTLYVDPTFFGEGAGRALLRAAFLNLRQQGFARCIIWMHARNNARFFYERMGGRAVAERVIAMGGGRVPETAFGWRKLALAEANRA